MSHSALYIYGSDGEMKRFKEFKNSWGMGPRVWNPLSEKHLAKLFKDGESPVFLEEWERLINRRNDLDLAWFELNVLEALLDMGNEDLQPHAVMLALDLALKMQQ